MDEKKPPYRIIEAKPNPISWKDVFAISSLPVFIASLCCVSPLLLLSLGLVTLSAASELSDVFYGTYRWVFRIIGLAALLATFVLYLRRTGVCTLDDAKKRRNEILNKLILVLTAGIVGYIVFLYVIVHYIGVWLNVWK